MAIEPVTREERFLAAAGGRSVTPPAPITRKEQLLQGIIDAVKSGGATPDVIEGAINDYLNANPVQPGATTEQAAQIEQNKTDIADLQTEVDELKESGGNGSGQNPSPDGSGVTSDLKAALKAYFTNVQTLIGQTAHSVPNPVVDIVIGNARAVLDALEVQPEQPDSGIIQSGSILAITSGVTVTQTGAELIIR